MHDNITALEIMMVWIVDVEEFCEALERKCQRLCFWDVTVAGRRHADQPG